MSSSPTRPSGAAERRQQRGQLGRDELRIEPGRPRGRGPGRLPSGSRERVVVAADERVDDVAGEPRVALEGRAGRAQHELGVGGRAVVVDPELRGSPGALDWIVTPSSFQNAVAPATRPASRSATALKPIVIVLTLAGSPPDPDDLRSSTAVSLGTPVIPTVLPSNALGRADVRRRDHRGQRALDDRHDPDDVGVGAGRFIGDREVVDVEDREVDLAGLEQLDRVGRGRRRDHVQIHAVVAVVVRGRARRRCRCGRRSA